MAATMVVVFLSVLILHVLKYCIPVVVKQVVRVVFQESQLEGRLKAQIKQLGDEQSELNVKEEFPKFARIDRKMNKLKDELKKLRQSKTAKSFTFSWGLTLVLNSLQTFCFIFIIWRYRYEPMLVLNPDWFWPLCGLIAFPSGIPGAVGITFWILICNSILRRGQAVVSATWTQSKRAT